MTKSESESIQKELSRFGKYVIQQSRSILTKQKYNDSKKLYNSLKFDVKESNDVFNLSFFMEEYGVYQDQGVKGVSQDIQTRKTTSKYNPRNNKGKMWKQKAPNSPFSYKKNGKKPPASAFKKYAKSVGASPFAIAYSIWAQGLKPTMFFTKPFEAAFDRLPDDLIDGFDFNIEEILK
tara:strand:- start:6712 stop:7245 length:534 start_codon:yes stop_codon:yes gene_type:complete